MQLDITTCGVSYVLSHLKRAAREGHPFDVVISFESPGAEPPRAAPRLMEVAGAHWEHRQLIIPCDDVSRPGPGMRPPQRRQVQEAIKFVSDHAADRNGKLKVLVHCTAGLSRSTAMAYVLDCLARGGGSESDCIDAVLKRNPLAMPNAVIVGLGDALLERNGRMLMLFRNTTIRQNCLRREQLGL